MNAVSPPLRARAVRPLAAVAGVAALVPTLIHPQGAGPVLCPFRRVTGVWCPGCGMTRAMGWLLHGQFDRATRLHPAAPLVAAEAIIAVAVWFYGRRERPNAARVRDFGTKSVPALLVLNSVILLVIWVIRLKTGAFDDLR